MNQHAPAAFDFVPHSIEAEQHLLGAVLMVNDVWFAASEVVEVEHFYDPFHRALWSMICDRMRRNENCSPVAVTAAMGEDALVDLAGITVKQYVVRLAVEAAPASSVGAFAKVIRDAWSRRQLVALTREIQAKALRMEGQDVSALLDDADTELSAIRFGKQVSGVSHISTLVDRSLHATSEAYRLDGKPGFDTGIEAIDEMIGPMMAGDLVTILAPSGHGKSALGAQILRNNAAPSLDANRMVPGVFFSMEMDGMQNARRILASESGVTTRAQKSGTLVQAEYEKLADVAGRIKAMPLYIDDAGRQKVSSIIKKARAMKKAYGVRIGVVDHAKLFKREHLKQDRFEVLADAAMALKDAAKELDMLFILLAQVTSESLKKSNTWRVRAADLWGGETVRECSDIFLTVCLPHKWLTENEPEREDQKGKWAADSDKWFGKGEVAAPKVRDGETGSPRSCAWDGKRMMFGNL